MKYNNPLQNNNNMKLEDIFVQYLHKQVIRLIKYCNYLGTFVMPNKKVFDSLLILFIFTIYNIYQQFTTTMNTFDQL